MIGVLTVLGLTLVFMVLAWRNDGSILPIVVIVACILFVDCRACNGCSCREQPRWFDKGAEHE